MEGPLFSESNTVMPRIISLVLAMVFILILVFTAYLVMMEDDFSVSSVSGMVLVSTAALLIAVSVLLFVLRIKITVTYETLTVGLFKGRVVPAGDIQSVTSEDFSAFKDYFGWGLKVGRKGFGYIVAGTNKGLRINLNDGKSFFISSKRTFEFESAMNMALKARKHTKN